MNNDLTEDSAVWRALFGGGLTASPACRLLVVYLSSTCQRAAEDGFAAEDGSVCGDGRSSRCCTLGEFSHDWDCVSVRAVQEKCDEKGRGGVRIGIWRDSGHPPACSRNEIFPNRHSPALAQVTKCR